MPVSLVQADGGASFGIVIVRQAECLVGFSEFVVRVVGFYLDNPRVPSLYSKVFFLEEDRV